MTEAGNIRQFRSEDSALLGATIRSLRLELGLTQTQVAEPFMTTA